MTLLGSLESVVLNRIFDLISFVLKLEIAKKDGESAIEIDLPSTSHLKNGALYIAPVKGMTKKTEANMTKTIAYIKKTDKGISIWIPDEAVNDASEDKKMVAEQTSAESKDK